MASTTSGAVRATTPASAGQRGEPAEGQGPGRDVALVGRERVHPGDPAPRRCPRGGRAGRPSPARGRGAGTTAATVTTWSRWPRPTSSTAMLVITSPVGATSGAKCGQRTRMFTRGSGGVLGASRIRRRTRVVGPASASADASQVKRGRPRRPPGRSASLAIGVGRAAAHHRVGPRRRRRRDRAARRRRPRPRAAPPRSTASTGHPAAIASSTGMPKPS